MHQTASDSAEGTLAGYDVSTNGDGAHFLVGKSGDTYQCVSLKKRCWHVAPIKSRCLQEHTCSPVEKKYFADLLKTKVKTGMTQRAYNYTVSDHEKAKPYPERYPGNDNSIGIEVVGNTIGDNTKEDVAWENPTVEQDKVTHWLVPALLDALGLKRDDVLPSSIAVL